jgi:hypothetical protein
MASDRIGLLDKNIAESKICHNYDEEEEEGSCIQINSKWIVAIHRKAFANLACLTKSKIIDNPQ